MCWPQGSKRRFLNSSVHYIYAKEELAMSVQDGYRELENYFGKINKNAKRKISGLVDEEEFEYESFPDTTYDTTVEEFE